MIFALAGMLVFETPAAAYAAGTAPVVESSVSAGDDISVLPAELPTDSVEQEENHDGVDTDRNDGKEDTEPDHGSVDTDRNDGSAGTGQGGGSTEEESGGADQSGDDIDPGNTDRDNADKVSDQETEAGPDADDKTTTAEPDQTVEAEKQHKFSASIAEDFTSLTLQAVLEGYGEEVSAAALTYEYTDALGRVRRDQDNVPTAIVKGEDGSYTLTRTVEAPVLVAAEVYAVRLAVQYKDTDSEKVVELSENIEVTTPAACYEADKIIFTCAQNDEDESQLDYALVWEKDSAPAPESVRVYYRPQGSGANTYSESTAVLADGAASHSVSGLIPGCTYELEMFAGGVRKSCVQKLTKSTGISLGYVEGDSALTGVYDVTRTLKVQANDEQPLAEAYYVTMSYAPKGGEPGPGIVTDDQLVLTAQNNYQATVCTADYSGIWLHPDTEYSLVWQVEEAQDSAQPAAVLYETIRTGTSTVEMKPTIEGHEHWRYRVTLAAEDVVNMQANSSRQVSLYPYLRKAGKSDFVLDSVTGVQFTSANKYSNVLDLWMLNENTEYELSLRDENNMAEYVRVSFRTPPDYRTLSDAEASIDTATSAVDAKVTFQVRLNDNVEREYTYIIFYRREVGGTEPPMWVYMDKVMTQSITQTVKYTNYEFKRGSTYEYAIVLSQDGYRVDPDFVTKEGWKLTGKIQVPEAVSVTRITLDPAALYLNTAFPDEEGYGWQEVEVLAEPADARRIFNASCSNKNVADTDSTSSGYRIRALEPGEAVLTVESVPADDETETVTGECLIKVVNYQVRYQEAGSDQAVPLEDNLIKVPKRQPLDGKLVLYSINADGSETVVPEDAYTIESGSESVVTLKDGVPQANYMGTTKLFFKQKGVPEGWKSYVTWTTLPPGRRFSVTGITSADKDYPAVENGDGYKIVCAPDIKYKVEGEISSGEKYDPELFLWTIEDTQIATVDALGWISAVKPGETVLMVEPKNKNDGTWSMKDPLRIPITVTQIPEINKTYSCFAITNIHKKLGDLECPLEGWEWEYPETRLVVNGAAGESTAYPFYMVCRQDGSYPRRCRVDVYMGEVTGMSVTDDGHEGVVEVSADEEENGDTMSLKLQAEYYGTYNPYLGESSRYQHEWTLPDVPGLQIDMGSHVTNSGHDHYDFKVRATRPGTYTLRPTLTVKDINSNTKAVFRTTYKIRAVKDPLAKSIELTPDLGEQEGLSYDQRNNRVAIDVELLGKDGTGLPAGTGAVDGNAPDTFVIHAAVKGRTGQELDTKLTWKSSDKKVAALSVSRDTHTVTVSLKGEGHATLTAVAKDISGVSAPMRVEIRNHEPRVNISKIKVNTVYDYTQEAGRKLARDFSGVLEILPVYGEKIQNVLLYEKEAADHGNNGLTLYDCGNYEWIICPDEGLEPGELQRTLLIETSAGKTYEYPLRISLVEKQPKVAVKQKKTVNLFYRHSAAEFWLDVPVGHKDIKETRWESQAGESDQGFGPESKGISIYSSGGLPFTSFEQREIQLNQKNKPVNPDVLKGSLQITLAGYREPFTVKTSIKYVYKKPVLVTKASSEAMSPDAYTMWGTFKFYNKTDACVTYYDPEGRDKETYYHVVKCDSSNVDINMSNFSDSFRFYYVRDRTDDKKTSEKLTFTVEAKGWREPLQAVHTIKLGMPKAYLTTPRIVFNTNRLSEAVTEVRLKDVVSSATQYEDIVITGKSAGARKLLDEDLLTIRRVGAKITIRPTKEKETVEGKGTRSVLPAGTYAYKVVPYYRDVKGERKAGNAMTLNVQIINKTITAKVKTKGTLDLTRAQPNYAGQVQMMNRIILSTTFRNIGNDYKVEKMELTGNYSNYFWFTRNSGTAGGSLNHNGNKLRAGINYKLYMRYTIKMADGSTFQVVSEPFNVKPKHSAPKVKITGNNQTLYASADNVSRTYGLVTPQYKEAGGSSYFYNHQIRSAYGSLDCNKDGKPDIEVTKVGTDWSYQCDLSVSIKDRDGVLAVTGAKGKTYTIPVTVQLRGRDGINRDVKTSIKVTVKR